MLSLAPLAGNLPHDAALEITKEVWTSLPQLAQEMARAAGQIRARFTKSAVLQDLNTCLDVTAATTNDVKVIRETGGTIDVGSVQLPVLTGFSEHPKGEDNTTHLVYFDMISFGVFRDSDSSLQGSRGRILHSSCFTMHVFKLLPNL